MSWTLRRLTDDQDMEALDSNTYCASAPGNLLVMSRTCRTILDTRKLLHSIDFVDYYLEGTITYANGDT